jgi:Uncharacterised protein family (UPF0150).
MERRLSVVSELMVPEFDVVIEQDEEGYYVASVPEIAGCHTQAHSLDGFPTPRR